MFRKTQSHLKKDEDQATQATQQQTRPPNPHNNKPGRPNHSLYFCNFGLKIRKLFYYSNSLDSARSASLPSVDTHRRKYNSTIWITPVPLRYLRLTHIAGNTSHKMNFAILG